MDRSRKEKSSNKNQPAGSNKGISQSGSASKHAVKKKGKDNAGSPNGTVHRKEESAKQTGQTEFTHSRVNKAKQSPLEDYSSNVVQHMEVHRNGITLSSTTQSRKSSPITGSRSEIQRPISIMNGSNVFSLYKDSIWQEPPWTLVPTEIEQKPQYPDDLYESHTAEWDEIERDIREAALILSSTNGE